MPAHPKMPTAAVRAAYEAADESVRGIARRFGVSDRAIRNRAAAEGWARTQRDAGARLLTESDIEAMFLTEQDIDAMIITAAGLARLASGASFWRR